MPDKHVSCNRMPHSLYLYQFFITQTAYSIWLRAHTPKHVHEAHIITRTYFVLNSLFHFTLKKRLSIFLVGIAISSHYTTLLVYSLQLSLRRIHSQLSSTHAPTIFKTISNTISFYYSTTLYCVV